MLTEVLAVPKPDRRVDLFLEKFVCYFSLEPSPRLFVLGIWSWVDLAIINETEKIGKLGGARPRWNPRAKNNYTQMRCKVNKAQWAYDTH